MDTWIHGILFKKAIIEIVPLSFCGPLIILRSIFSTFLQLNILPVPPKADHNL